MLSIVIVLLFLLRLTTRYLRGFSELFENYLRTQDTYCVWCWVGFYVPLSSLRSLHYFYSPYQPTPNTWWHCSTQILPHAFSWLTHCSTTMPYNQTTRGISLILPLYDNTTLLHRSRPPTSRQFELLPYPIVTSLRLYYITTLQLLNHGQKSSYYFTTIQLYDVQ